MDTLIETLKAGLVPTGDVTDDVRRFLIDHDCSGTAAHSAAVAESAAWLARRFGVDVDRATTAAWLHDVSAVIPSDQRVAAAAAWGVEILDEERALPMLLHQKLSAVLAESLFGIRDKGVLSAVQTHTTLYVEADVLAKVVFVADKIAWDQHGRPPYVDDLMSAIETSLDAGVCVYLSYLWRQRPVLHPWFVAAYNQLCAA